MKFSRPANDFDYCRSPIFGVYAVDEARASPFNRVTNEALRRRIPTGRSDSYDAFFLPEAHPAAFPDVQISFALAIPPDGSDLVEQRWRFGGLPLRMVENINACRVEIPLQDWTAPYDPNAVAARAASILRLTGEDLRFGTPALAYQVDLPWADLVKDGDAASSNLTESAFNTRAWWTRVDAFVDGETLNVVLYKRPYNSPHIGFFKGDQWLSPSFHIGVRADASSSASDLA